MEMPAEVQDGAEEKLNYKAPRTGAADDCWSQPSYRDAPRQARGLDLRAPR